MSAREAEAAAADAQAEELLGKAIETLERASIPERAARRLHPRARLIHCEEAQPLLDKIRDLRSHARWLRALSATPPLIGPTASAPIGPPPSMKAEPVNPAANMTREQKLDAVAAGFPDLPAGMLAKAKASGQSVVDFANAAAQAAVAVQHEAVIASLANGAAAFIPGAKLMGPQTIRVDADQPSEPAASEDELVDAIVAFLPSERRRHG